MSIPGRRRSPRPVPRPVTAACSNLARPSDPASPFTATLCLAPSSVRASLSPVPDLRWPVPPRPMPPPSPHSCSGEEVVTACLPPLYWRRVSLWAAHRFHPCHCSSLLQPRVLARLSQGTSSPVPSPWSRLPRPLVWASSQRSLHFSLGAPAPAAHPSSPHSLS